MRATLIHNPAAGDARPTADDLRDILAAAGFQVRYQSSKKAWKKALSEEADLIVVAGGDGTVAKVLRQHAGNRVPVGIIPVGTSNNVARSLGLIGDARELVEGWRLDRWSALDVGVVEHDGTESSFVEACGAGLFAAALSKGEDLIEDVPTLVGNKTDRGLSLLERLLELRRPSAYELRLDGRDMSDDYLAVEILNIPFAGPSVPLSPEADAGDGLLDVVLVGAGERAELERYLRERIDSKSAPAPTLPVQRCRRVSLQVPEGHPVRVDDELLDSADTGGGRLEIELRPAALRLLLPAER